MSSSPSSSDSNKRQRTENPSTVEDVILVFAEHDDPCSHAMYFIPIGLVDQKALKGMNQNDARDHLYEIINENSCKEVFCRAHMQIPQDENKNIVGVYWMCFVQ